MACRCGVEPSWQSTQRLSHSLLLPASHAELGVVLPELLRDVLKSAHTSNRCRFIVLALEIGGRRHPHAPPLHRPTLSGSALLSCGRTLFRSQLDVFASHWYGQCRRGACGVDALCTHPPCSMDGRCVRRESSTLSSASARCCLTCRPVLKQFCDPRQDRRQVLGSLRCQPSRPPRSHRPLCRSL